MQINHSSGTTTKSDTTTDLETSAGEGTSKLHSCYKIFLVPLSYTIPKITHIFRWICQNNKYTKTQVSIYVLFFCGKTISLKITSEAENVYTIMANFLIFLIQYMRPEIRMNETTRQYNDVEGYETYARENADAALDLHLASECLSNVT